MSDTATSMDSSDSGTRPNVNGGERTVVADGGGGDGVDGNPAHITWDEETIAEHDKLRGTRQKIDEPSTPYHYMAGDASDTESQDGRGSGGSTARGGEEDDEEGSLNGTVRSQRSHSGQSPGSAGGGRGGGVVLSEVNARLPSEENLQRERATRWDSEEGEGGGEKASGAFQAKRAQHYNEFQMLQQWRKNKEEDDDDDDDMT